MPGSGSRAMPTQQSATSASEVVLRIHACVKGFIRIPSLPSWTRLHQHPRGGDCKNATRCGATAPATCRDDGTEVG